MLGVGRYHGKSVMKGETSRFSANDYDPFDMLTDGVKIVPCRWTNSGWKYVEDEPAKQKFFSNPNRANSFGTSSLH